MMGRFFLSKSVFGYFKIKKIVPMTTNLERGGPGGGGGGGVKNLWVGPLKKLFSAFLKSLILCIAAVSLSE